MNEPLDGIHRTSFFPFFSDGPNVIKSLKTKLLLVRILPLRMLENAGEFWLHKVLNAFSKGLEAFLVEVETAAVDTCYFFKPSSVPRGHLKEQSILRLAEAALFWTTSAVIQCHLCLP